MRMLREAEVTHTNLTEFVRESNLIEGILREPTLEEIHATEDFLALDRIAVDDLSALVNVFAPGAKLRYQVGMDVRVGRYSPPRGGEHILPALQGLLFNCEEGRFTPYQAHVAYEMLHPFMDGNGRSGRALWLWMRKGQAPLGFLHHFYYETLDAAQR